MFHSQTMRSALLLHSILCLTMRYLDTNGFDIPNVFALSHFNILLATGESTLMLRASNHPYHTALAMFTDPCNYSIELGAATIGNFDICARILRYTADSRNYEIRHMGNGYKIQVRNGPIELVKEYAGTDASSQKHDPSPVLKKSRPYRINVFIFNDIRRAGYYGSNINKETFELLDIVDNMYKESNASIRINLAGVLNLRDELAAVPDVLAHFREAVEPIKYDSANLGTPLSSCDLALLLTDRGSNGQLHGMSYFGGSNGLNRSYGVVFTGMAESQYFIAKKIAHEIAHTLGVHHDGAKGHLMEASTCDSCEEAPRLFSKESISKMNQFIEEYKSIFEDHEPEADDGKVITSVDDAQAFVKSRRRHSFSDIINMRLGGRPPETVSFTYYLIISIVFYTISIFIAIYYLK